MPVSGLSEVSAISDGDRFALALLKKGTVKARGFADVGDGTASDKNLPISVCAVGEKEAPCSHSLSEVSAVAAGERFSLALLKNGTVVSWGGENRYGQLGDNTYESSSVPVPVSGLTKVRAIAAGEDFALSDASYTPVLPATKGVHKPSRTPRSVRGHRSRPQRSRWHATRHVTERISENL